MKAKLLITFIIVNTVLVAGCNNPESTETSSIPTVAITEQSTVQNGTQSFTESITQSPTTRATEPITEAPTERPTEKPTPKPTEKPTETEILFSTSTSILTQEIDKELIAITESKGISVTKTEENISFSATQSILNEIAEEYKNFLTGNIKSEDEESLVSEIKISEGYKSIEYYVKSGFDTNIQSSILLLYIKPMGDLQMLTGVAKSEDEIRFSQKVINVSTNEIMSENVIPDDLDKIN